jgi:hypothetical protein
VSDRGPNLVCALICYDTLFCYPHRLNNILKCSFFQSQSKKKKEKESSTTVQPTDSTTSTNMDNSHKNEENDNCSSSSTDNDDEKMEPTLPIKNKKTYKKQSSTKINDVDVDNPEN